MKIIIDSYIPYIKGALDQVADVVYLPYQEINAGNVRNADALIVRTRTHCNEQLLAGSKIKFIASATIGYDHIDASYCCEKGISWTNAPGCNALSVAQYIASALSFLSRKNDFKLRDKTIGVVGVGAVGSKIVKLASSFGMRVLLNDPPRERNERSGQFVSLACIAEQADIITFHTLLNIAGEDKTFHLGNRDFFKSLQRRPVIINAARGEIVNTAALLQAIEEGDVSDVVLDCWENEPFADSDLLSNVALATPHIAGYSADGKSNAAQQSVRAVSRFFGLGLNDWQVEALPAPQKIGFSQELTVKDFFLQTYPIEADSDNLRHHPENFETQRSNYPFRREPKAYLNDMSEKFRSSFVDQFSLFFDV